MARNYEQEPPKVPKPDSPEFAPFVISSGESYAVIRRFQIVEGTTELRDGADVLYQGKRYPTSFETGVALAQAQQDIKPH